MEKHEPRWNKISSGLRKGKLISYHVCQVKDCGKLFVLGVDGEELPREH